MATPCCPQSCDPGYGELGIQEGASTLRQQAQLFGLNSIPPIDLPALNQQPTGGVIASTIGMGASGTDPLPADAQAFQAYSAIGQDRSSRTPRSRTRWSRRVSRTAA